MDTSGHTFYFSENSAGDSARQQNGNVYNSVTNHYSNSDNARFSEPMYGSRAELYTVAWICSFPETGFTASCKLFDKTHEKVPGRVVQSRFKYAFGEMKGHNVVMACLKSTGKGYQQSLRIADIAREMEYLFPSLRFALLVGIGGGVWSNENDIRLGDVVVGKSDTVEKRGGLMQYSWSNGKSFSTQAIITAPPMYLLSALGSMSVALQAVGWALLFVPLLGVGVYDQCIELYQRRKERRLAALKDHEHEPHRAPRPDGGVVVHYGIIASNSHEMTEPKVRDWEAVKYDILCFETEAAGLNSNFPCLVIRGIAHHCNGLKRGLWHPHAATSAAVFAKEYLAYLNPEMIAKQPTLQHQMKAGK